jgi:N-acylglucosamine 2-epimerase
MTPKIKEITNWYASQLKTSVIPFWENHSVDLNNGGFFTCLLKDGTVYDTDKFIWLQARQVWTFSMLYQKVEPNSKWLEIANYGAEFLNPLIQAYNIFSDCFAALAFGSLYKISQNPEHRIIAQDTFYKILKRRDNPKGKYNKSYPGTRDLKGFSLPMIMCNLALELSHILEPKQVSQILEENTHVVLEEFYHKEKKLIYENILPGGELFNSFEGRLINPGHGIEAMWFLMDIGEENGNKKLIEKAAQITLEILEFSWDPLYGGIFYFLDSEGHPPQQLEWDQKLWWVHIETLIALAKAYKLTGEDIYWNKFLEVHKYTSTHFPDPEFGEWYGYLNRRGEILLPLKGGKWKGFFHIPRGLLQIWKTLDAIS